MTTSPLLTGGAGFDFEDSVAAVYLTALLLESGVLGLGQFTASHERSSRPSRDRRTRRSIPSRHVLPEIGS